MTDRELLELAARAAGLTSVDYAGVGYDGRSGLILTDEMGRQTVNWSPLTDDGDALRLAVKLGADIQPKGNGVEVWVFESRASSGVVEYGDDHYAATRRAIVRAAAEIGKDMK